MKTPLTCESRGLVLFFKLFSDFTRSNQKTHEYIGEHLIIKAKMKGMIL